MTMPIMDLSFAALRDTVKQLDQEVYDLSVGELNLTCIEPVTYLYAIAKLGPSNSAARWMIDLGLTESVIGDYIKQNLPTRPPRRRPVRSRKVSSDPQLSWAMSLYAMMATLRSLDGHMNGKNLFVHDVVVAAVDSIDPHVVALFNSVDMSIDDVRAALGFADTK